MTHGHAVAFEDLADWADERLDSTAEARVRAHLATGCPQCEADLAWLHRVLGAARAGALAEPPAEAVAQAKQLYRSRSRASRLKPLAAWPSLRWVPAVAVVVLVLVATVYLTQVPTLLAGQAWLSEVEGTAEARAIGETDWHSVSEDERFGQGDLLRASEGPVVLRLFDGTRLLLQPGAQLTLDILRSGLLGRSYHIALSQQSGSVEYDVAPLRGSRCRFEAQTPTVRVAVRGTRFVITVETVQETRVTVLQGSVRLESGEQTEVLEEREAAIVPASAPLVRLPTLTPTFTPAAEPWHTPSPSLPPSPTTTATPAPTMRVERTPAPAPVVATQTPLPTARPAVTATVALTETGVVTPAMGTDTPQPTGTMVPDRVEFTGIIEAFPPEILGRWRIDGRDVMVQRTTRIRGRPAVGLSARVVCHVSAASNVRDVALVAVTIDIVEPKPSPDSRPTATPWWGAVTTLLPPPVQTMLPDLPALPDPTNWVPPDLLSTMVAWPTEHPIWPTRPARTTRPRATAAPTREATATEAQDANAVAPATATPTPALSPSLSGG